VLLEDAAHAPQDLRRGDVRRRPEQMGEVVRQDFLGMNQVLGIATDLLVDPLQLVQSEPLVARGAALALALDR